MEVGRLVKSIATDAITSICKEEAWDLLELSTALAMPPEFSVAGSPVKGQGTLAASWVSQPGNRVLASPVGSPGAPVFRALDNSDLPVVDVAHGGTNSSTPLANDRPMVSSGGQIVEGPALADGQLLVGTTGGAPTATGLTAGANVTITLGPGSITIAATGTVTSVGLALPTEFNITGSPVTSSGTLTGAWVSQAANRVFASPDSAAGIPSFRGLVNNDLPVVDIAHGGTNSSTALNNNRVMVSAAGQIVEGPALADGELIIGTTGGAPTAAGLTAGSNITITPGAGSITISSTNPGGTVTSVGLALPGEFTVTGSPVTTTGTLTGNWVSQAANLVFASPNGTPGTPSFRALAASDIPNLDASKITTGILPIARGGTNSGTALNNGRVMVSSGGAIVEAATMTDGQLIIGDTGGAPVVAALTGGTGITITNGAGSITVTADNNGTVTSVGLSLPSEFTVTGSPVTAVGTLTGTWVSQAANLVFAGPSSGGAATPTFRALVASDIPAGFPTATGTLNTVPKVVNATGPVYGDSAITDNGTTVTVNTNFHVTANDAQLGTVSSADGVLKFANATNGNIVTIQTGVTTAPYALTLPTSQGGVDTFLKNDGSGNLSWAVNPLGTVTSVGLSLPSEFTVTGSPVTTSGTLTGSWANAAQNAVFAGPASGGPGTPAFRILVAADIPNLDASKITTGVLPIARGGTNSGTALNNDRVMVSSGGAIVEAAAMTDGQLVIGSTGSAPVVAGLTAGANITITSGAGSITITATNPGGTVTSVGLSLPGEFTVSGSPVTTSGTLTGAWVSQPANQVFASPNGAPGVPGFRALVSADIPIMVGSGPSAASGAVPTPPAVAGTSKFLREDGVWAAPGILQASTTTTDATATVVVSIPIPDNSAAVLYAFISAFRTNGTGQAGYNRQVSVYRRGGGVMIQGTIDTPFRRESPTGYDATFQTTATSIDVVVQGLVGHTMNWTVAYVVAQAV